MPTNLYGPGDNFHSTNSHVLPALIRRFHEAELSKARSVSCWGTGSPLREFLHVDDLAEACVFALERWSPASGELTFLNVGTGEDLKIRDLADMVASMIGFSGSILWSDCELDGTPKKQLNIDRITSLGWKARINLEEGLKDTIKTFKDQYASRIKNLS